MKDCVVGGDCDDKSSTKMYGRALVGCDVERETCTYRYHTCHSEIAGRKSDDDSVLTDGSHSQSEGD